MEICKWKYNADSPVMFMIDDLCNSWVDTNGNCKIDRGEDFGHGMYFENSSMRYLEEEILNSFPKVKVNFYVPVGKRIGMLLNSSIKIYSAPINENKEISDFFKNIHKNPRYELSYHGLTHGKVFEKASDQLQEWECYNSLDEALETISIGKSIFKEVTGEYPKGGKYCGYTGDKYGDESIDKSDFLWWHRHWNGGIEEECSDLFCGKDKNKLTSFDIKEFGENKIIDIPSTFSGYSFNIYGKSKLKNLIKLFLKPLVMKKKKRKINFILKNKLILSIQEHICPARDDGKKQTPNIFDDKKSLIRIFKYLKNKNVWYCTGTELAEYYYLRKNLIIIKDQNSININTKNIKKNISNKEITIKLNKNYEEIIYPNGKKQKINNKIVTIDIIDGNYSLVENKNN